MQSFFFLFLFTVLLFLIVFIQYTEEKQLENMTGGEYFSLIFSCLFRL